MDFANTACPRGKLSPGLPWIESDWPAHLQVRFSWICLRLYPTLLVFVKAHLAVGDGIVWNRYTAYERTIHSPSRMAIRIATITSIHAV